MHQEMPSKRSRTYEWETTQLKIITQNFEYYWPNPNLTKLPQLLSTTIERPSISHYRNGSLYWNYPQPLYKSGTTSPLDTTSFSEKSNESLDREDPIVIRKRNQRRKLGRLPRKTPMWWMWTSCPLKKETKQWEKDYALDAGNMDI